MEKYKSKNFKKKIFLIIYNLKLMGIWGLGIGVWELGIGYWA